MEVTQTELSMCGDVVDFLLENSFSKLSYDSKMLIKSINKPRPQLNSLVVSTSKQNRGFNVDWYDKCDWLTASTKRSKLFCWPCLLFSSSNETVVWTKSGFGDLKNLPRSIERHSKSKDHISCGIKFRLLGKQNITNVLDKARKQEIENYNNAVKENREIFKRLIDTVIFLGCQELAFRGHDESSQSVNKGNFQELVNFLSKYDNKLNNFLQKATVFHGTSKTIQNDIIESVSHVVEQKIFSEISDALYFSWQVDETTDIACRSQLSVVFRYVVNGTVVERFAGFYDVSSGRTAEDLFNFLIDKFGQYDLKNKLIAQTYDGAAVMASDLNGLQTKIKTIAPHALFTHCYAHCLNLVLSKACNGIRDVRIFFANLSGFSSFFSKSTKRTEVLNNIAGCKLPTNAPTRWNFTSRAVLTVSHNRRKLIEVFDFIITDDSFQHDQITIREAGGLKNYLLDDHFLFFLHTFKLIFQESDIVFSLLQDKNTDITYARNRLNALVIRLQEYRNNEIYFNDIYNNYNIPEAEVPEPETSVPTKKRKITYNLTDHKQNYKQLFVEIIDTIIGQINIRFSDLSNLKFFDLVKKENFESYSRAFPQGLLNILLQQYSFFDSVALKSELSVVYSDKGLFGNSRTPSEILSYIFHNDLINCLPEFYKLLYIIVTIPVTSASVERSFSALKRIKSFTRNTISQERLKNVSILSIEKTLVKELSEKDNFYDNVTNYFAEQKDRRLPLIYKQN